MGMQKRKQKHNYKIKQILKTKQGATLVEMVVTFALIAIFFAGISTLLYRAMETYHQIRGLNYAEQVSDTLMDKVAGTISKANPSSPDGVEKQYTMVISENGAVIELYDNTSSPIAITTTHDRNRVEDGDEELSEREDYNQRGNQLLLYYYKVKDYEAVDWTFDDAMYMGFYIESLTFHRVDANGVTYPKNVIRIDLALKSDQYNGIFESTRYVECYNFSTEELKNKIYDTNDAPEQKPEPEPEGNHGFGGDTKSDDPFVQAVGNYFKSGWIQGAITDKKGQYTVYYKITKTDGQTYISVINGKFFEDEDNINNQQIRDWAKEIAGDPNAKILDIRDDDIGNDEEAKLLKEIVQAENPESDFDKYTISEIEFDDERLELIEYRDQHGGKKKEEAYY